MEITNAHQLTLEIEELELDLEYYELVAEDFDRADRIKEQLKELRAELNSLFIS